MIYDSNIASVPHTKLFTHRQFLVSMYETQNTIIMYVHIISNQTNEKATTIIVSWVKAITITNREKTVPFQMTLPY